MPTVIDEYTRECQAVRLARRIGSYEVIEALADVMLWRGFPQNIRPDKGPKFAAAKLRKWLGTVGTGTLYIERGIPGKVDTARVSTGKLRDECSNGELSYSIRRWAMTAITSGLYKEPQHN